MTESRFVQLHTLTSYPAALLNRDDAGLAKRLPFGGATRTRISSQCLKRHWRVAEDEWALARVGVPMGKRSKLVGERRIITPLIASGVPNDIAEAVGTAFVKAVYGEKADDPKQRQALLLGQPELDWLKEQASAVAAGATDGKDAKTRAEAFLKGRDVRANLLAMRHGAGLESALFGRMVTSDLLANRDAAIHVAHSFTVHAEESESDYFTVVDDLKSRAEGDDTGSAGIFDMELTSGLYYGYVVVDVPLLTDNLGQDRELAAKVVEHMLHLVATVSPGAKLGSTAPYAYAQLMLVELGKRQPRTLANAFRKPVGSDARRGTMDLAVERLAAHLGQIDEAYGAAEARRFLSVEPATLPAAQRLPLDGLAQWAADAVRAGTLPS
jgi:CRISPR system Cascade subunit CasC